MYKVQEVLTVNPFQYQIEGIVYALNHNYCLIADEMGLGKSLQGIAVSRCLQIPTLVVCPAFLKVNWQREIDKLCKEPQKIYLIKNKESLRDIPEGMDFYIINYDLIHHCELVKPLFKKVKLVIADEAHYLKSSTSKRSRFFFRWVKETKPDRVILLTGTPMPNRVSEMYVPLSIVSLNPHKNSGDSIGLFFKSETHYKNHFMNRTTFKIKGRIIAKWDGFKNHNDFHNLCSGKMIRRLVKDVLELPPITNKFIEVEPKPSMYSEIDEKKLGEDWAKYEKVGDSPSIIESKTHSAYAKANETAEYVGELLTQGESPLIVFTDHVASGMAIKKNLEMDSNWKAELINGEVQQEKRQLIVDKFQRKEINVLIATIKTCSVGLNLVQSRNVIFNDLSWTPADNEQAVKRIHRIGQEKKCVIHYIYRKGVDDLITKTLTKKLKVIDLAFNKEENTNELN